MDQEMRCRHGTRDAGFTNNAEISSMKLADPYIYLAGCKLGAVNIVTLADLSHDKA